MRKKAGLKPVNKILVQYRGSSALNKILAKRKDFVKKEVIAEDVEFTKTPKMKFIAEKELKIDNETLWLGIKKI